MALSETTKARIERHALGQALTSWGDLSYEQVLDSLRADGQTWNTNDNIMVWLALDENYAEYIAEHIEDVHATLTDFAESVVDETRESFIRSIAKAINGNGAENLNRIPTTMALQVLMASLRLEDEDDE